MMFTDPYGWFPNPLFTNLFPLLFFASFAIDYIVPRWTNPEYQRKSLKSDHGSYLVITLAIFVTMSLSIYFRMRNIGTLRGLFQWLGLLLIIAGTGFRQWALIHLGRFFSRTVQIESGHKVITTGPYHWIRHPAYTGMIVMYVGVSLALGTWVGAVLSFILVTSCLLYRIHIEEKTLIAALGDEYREYMTKTWRLFPGW